MSTPPPLGPVPPYSSRKLSNELSRRNPHCPRLGTNDNLCAGNSIKDSTSFASHANSERDRVLPAYNPNIWETETAFELEELGERLRAGSLIIEWPKIRSSFRFSLAPPSRKLELKKEGIRDTR